MKDFFQKIFFSKNYLTCVAANRNHKNQTHSSHERFAAVDRLVAVADHQAFPCLYFGMFDCMEV